MKKHNLINIALVGLLFTVSCKQETIKLQEPTTTTPPNVTYTKGSADFSKFVSIGNSLTAGFQAGALFTAGQENSFPLIMSQQFQAVGGSTTFNQPDINSVNGYNSTYSNPALGIILGRLILFAADGNPADAVPTPAGAPGVPAPYNTADLPGPYTGNKATLNNFGVPGILLGQLLLAQTGGPSTNNPYYNALYARFASNPGTSTILGDVISTQPTFFSFDLGNNDVLGYAISGGDGSVPITSQTNFQNYYNTIMSTLLSPSNYGSGVAPKGVVSTIPDVTTLPYFFTVTWNALPLDAATAAEVTTELADNYNLFLLAMEQNQVLSASEVALRTLTYTAGQNPILITDTDLTNLAPYMTGPYAGLLPYAQARQTTATDLVTLAAGGILGTEVGGNPANVYGVTVPLSDTYVLVPSEIDSIETATTGFNSIINSVATTYSTQLAVADVNQQFHTLVSAGGTVVNGVTITPPFAPPTGGFSEDGVHPNSRGYAYLANIFISAIEAKFGATIPLADIANYPGTGLPVVP